MNRSRMISAVIAIMLVMCGRAWGYGLYFGGTHSHTSYSDGKGTPAEAFDTARYQGKADFWAVTDHYEQLDAVQGATGTAKKEMEWDVLQRTAKEKTEPGKFVALAGWEWFDQTQGHMNALNTGALGKLPQIFSLDRFYKWLPKHPEVITGFNHPSAEDDQRKVFNQCAIVPEVATQVLYIEVSRVEDLKYYYLALDKGWRLAPLAAEDNHEKTWGLEPNFAAVYADALTYDGLIEAFRAHRFYATSDRGLQLWFDANGQPMGSEVSGAVEFHVSVGSEKQADLKVQVLTNGGTVVKEGCDAKAKFKMMANNRTQPKYGCVMKTFAPPEGLEGTRWFAVLVSEPDGRYAVSAPIWVKK